MKETAARATIALISFSEQGAVIGRFLTARLPHSRLYLHCAVGVAGSEQRFERVFDLTAGLFTNVGGLVFIAPCGVAVRAIAPLVSHKLHDPAVVVVDVGGRQAISLLSGHEGGANELTLKIANLLDAEPVITTTSEAARNIIVGVGCRRGTPVEAIVGAVETVLDRCDIDIGRVRFMATADIKSNEPGVIAAAARLGLALRIVSSARIRASNCEFSHSDFVKAKVDLPAVAEPAALLAGWRTTLLLPKTIINKVTVALARENCMWSVSDRAGF